MDRWASALTLQWLLSVSATTTAITLGVVLLLAELRESAVRGELPPAVAAWIPNILAVALSTLLALMRQRRGDGTASLAISPLTAAAMICGRQSAERLGEVVDEIVRVLDAHRYPEQPVGDPEGGAALGRD